MQSRVWAGMRGGRATVTCTSTSGVETPGGIKPSVRVRRRVIGSVARPRLASGLCITAIPSGLAGVMVGWWAGALRGRRGRVWTLPLPAPRRA